MIAVLTGDIINSRQGQTSLWLNQLKSTLNLYGQTPKDWEIFRGDSFQLKTNPENALRIALHIKAVIKQVKPYDVRIAIGLGEQSYNSKTISESNGTAFVNSGEGFESLKKQTLTVVSENKKWDNTINIMINLALLTANSWSNTVAKVISTVIENPEKNQNDIALLLGKSQSTISEALKRGGYEEIMQLNAFYKEQILNL
ncbi:putative transcriptional regulator [Mesoflavibacter sabulilitoris]|jgi:predicted transcriptional regulator|uniref:Transcriptional regulator n=1 Tax=Mesoflavibacter zeaxanthinifaciens subsp. sabulilitoris TaxID=1520893 RepID=A0A2T1NGF5_9FLAO|nr:SatD family protein [Mesoflavibacter zeaxanthinifaciens]MBB3122981.1 putative transcriptional regulator [Mesoflavibacter zeaxanthinifaciens subsp. sabulilitoris]PSG91949.1 transcriptional regulator [Mesoflavibacter zeaxanthinifaciens subsp. sabulilitoris]